MTKNVRVIVLIAILIVSCKTSYIVEYDEERISTEVVHEYFVEFRDYEGYEEWTKEIDNNRFVVIIHSIYPGHNLLIEDKDSIHHSGMFFCRVDTIYSKGYCRVFSLNNEKDILIRLNKKEIIVPKDFHKRYKYLTIRSNHLDPYKYNLLFNNLRYNKAYLKMRGNGFIDNIGVIKDSVSNQTYYAPIRPRILMDR